MGNNVHDIIKSERRKRGIPTFYWSREMARLAQSQADYCAKVGRMVHSSRYAFQGGENLCGGKGSFSPRQTVNSWLGSPRHREYILSPRVRKAGVGIARRNGKMFYAWAFSDASPSYPDCPAYKSKATTIRLPKFKFRRHSMSFLLSNIGRLLILAAIPVFLFGLLLLLSPSFAFALLEMLPRDVQEAFMIDIFASATPRSWAFMIGGVALYFVGSLLKEK